MGGWKETEFGQIPKDWDVVTCEDVKSADQYSIAMGPFGSNIKAENFISIGVPVIRGTNMNYNRFVSGEFVYLSENKSDELKSSICVAGDLVFTHRGTLGQVCLIPKSNYSRYVISQSGMKLRVNKSIMDSLFLFYFFKSKYGQYQLLKNESQVGVPSISNPLSSLKSIQVPLPKLLEQQLIASVLSSLDDKIDLLHRQNKTLEGLAETLFRKWFIEDADPNWTKGKLGDYVSFKNGINYSRDENGDTEYEILNVRDIVESKYLNVGCHERINIDQRKAEPYLLKKGDIVVVRSASPGETTIILEDCPNLIYSGFSIRLRPVNIDQTYFLFQYLQAFKREMDFYSDGTTLKNLNQGILNSIELAMPAQNIIDCFNDLISSIFNKISQSRIQIQTLEKLRDSLLPKLMSGEVRVKL